MKKSKKIIVYLCLFFLSFSIVTDFKRQETQAIALVDDALLWAFGMLILGTGVVAVNNLQVPHMGSLVFDKLKTDGVSEEEFLIKSADGALKGIKIYDKVLDAVDYVSETIVNSNSDTYVEGEKSYNVNGFIAIPVPSVNSYKVGTTISFTSGSFFGPGTFRYGSSNNPTTIGGYNGMADLKTGESRTFNLTLRREVGSWDYPIWRVTNTIDGTNWGILYEGSKYFVFNNVGLTGDVSYYHSIPYSLPQIKENYNPTWTNDMANTYPVTKPGFMPLPTDTILDKPISTELPLTWDDVKGGVTDLPVDDTIPGEDTGEGEIETPSGWGWLLDILKSILNAILSIPGAILDFFEIDWTLVGEHVVYDEIFKTKFKPFYDVIYLLQNINVNPSTHSGKFYMVIPPEMGGDGQEHCVLDLTVGNEYIVMARAFINASIWIGFLWYIIKLFSPNLDIG